MIEKKENNSFWYTVYILYKSNILSRVLLTKIFEEVRKSAPEDVVKYLVEEEAKRA